MDKTKNELPLIGRKSSVKVKKIKRRSSDISKEEKLPDLEKEKLDDIKKKKAENEQQVKLIESTIEECGLPMAFNVIFSELVSKQIMPENFFTYTSLRLKEIGKEIEALKDKKPIYIEKLNEKIPEKRLKTDGDRVVKNDDIFMTAQKK